jgi:hypothetical protein
VQEVDVISSHERRIWHEIERHDAGTRAPARPGLPPPHWRRPAGRGVDDLPALVVSGIWSSIVLVLFGFTPAGLAVAATTALAALLWRYWPLLRR